MSIIDGIKFEFGRMIANSIPGLIAWGIFLLAILIINTIEKIKDMQHEKKEKD